MTVTKIPNSMLATSPLFFQMPTPQDFGAVGNNIADDTAAINAFLAAVTYGFVPPGNYKVTGQLVFKSEQHIFGLGHSSKIIYAKAPGAPANVLVFSGINNFSVSGLHVQVPYLTYGNVIPVLINACNTGELENVKITGGGQYPFYMQNCTDIAIKGSRISGGYAATGVQMNSCTNCSFDEGFIYAGNIGTGYGIQMNGGERNKARRNYIEKTPNDYFGIHSFSCPYSVIDDNDIYNTRREAIAAGGVSIGFSITNNRLIWTENLGVGDFGLSVAGGNADQVCADFFVSGNTIVNSALDGIGIAGFCQRGQVTNNIIRDSAYANANGFRAGIKVYGWQPGAFAQDTFISGNQVSRISSPGLQYIAYEAPELGSVGRTVVRSNKSVNIPGGGSTLPVFLTSGTSVSADNN